MGKQIADAEEPSQRRWCKPANLAVTVQFSTKRHRNLIRRPLARPANSFLGVHSDGSWEARPLPFVIPSAVEESLAILEIFRDVSVRAGLAYSLDMTEAQQAAASTRRSIQLPRL